MKKISRYFAFIIFCAIGASITFFIKADIFEDLFKNVDFEQLAKDMEKSLSNAEDNKDLPEMPPVPSTGTYEAPGTEKIIEPESTGIKKDRRTLFLDPDIRIIQGKNKEDKKKSVTEPTKKSRAAFSSFKQELENSLKIFEKNIDANPVLSPEFKEKYLQKIRAKIDEIIVASEIIDSKKVYQKIFLTPPADVASKKSLATSKWGDASSNLSPSSLSSNLPLSNSMKQLRQRYLNLIDDSNSLSKKIEITEEEESKEEDQIILEELAGTAIIEKEEDLPTYTPLVPSVPKIRGAKITQTQKTSVTKSKSSKKTKSAKQIKPAKHKKHTKLTHKTNSDVIESKKTDATMSGE